MDDIRRTAGGDALDVSGVAGRVVAADGLDMGMLLELLGRG
jgi:hypothetical protein